MDINLNLDTALLAEIAKLKAEIDGLKEFGERAIVAAKRISDENAALKQERAEAEPLFEIAEQLADHSNVHMRWHEGTTYAPKIEFDAFNVLWRAHLAAKKRAARQARIEAHPGYRSPDELEREARRGGLS